jgi:hypothetical protein
MPSQRIPARWPRAELSDGQTDDALKHANEAFQRNQNLIESVRSWPGVGRASAGNARPAGTEKLTAFVTDVQSAAGQPEIAEIALILADPGRRRQKDEAIKTIHRSTPLTPDLLRPDGTEPASHSGDRAGAAREASGLIHRRRHGWLSGKCSTGPHGQIRRWTDLLSAAAKRYNPAEQMESRHRPISRNGCDARQATWTCWATR